MDFVETDVNVQVGDLRFEQGWDDIVSSEVGKIYKSVGFGLLLLADVADVLVVVFLSLIKIFFIGLFEPLIKDIVLLFLHGLVLFVSDFCDEVKFLFFLSFHTFFFEVIHIKFHSVSDAS